MNVSEAIAYRRSVRGFLDTPVDVALVEAIIGRSARAATGGNLQPWHIDLVHGRSMDRLKALMRERMAQGPSDETPEYDIYPRELPSPYKERRYEVGEMLYGAIGIPREDKIGRMTWFARNFQFFGAPVGLFLTLDRRMGPPQWGDAGMMLQNIMLLLCEAGLDSCPQECWGDLPADDPQFSWHTRQPYSVDRHGDRVQGRQRSCQCADAQPRGQQRMALLTWVIDLARALRHWPAFLNQARPVQTSGDRWPSG